MKTTDLIGHTSESSAYLVADYPYGRTVRCRIRYWIEQTKGRGFRFCSQTENPKTLRWNAPKRSTYALHGAAMFLDNETGHVSWTGIGPYSDGAKVEAFLLAHPGALVSDTLLSWVDAAESLSRAFAEGRAVMTVNGEPSPRSEAEKGRGSEDARAWRRVFDLLSTRKAA